MNQYHHKPPALLIIDMVKDNFAESRNLAVTPFARAAVEPLNKLIGVFRDQKWPIVFATDAFHEEDFIFKGRMHPHSLSGTEGAEVVDELNMRDDDLWLQSPDFRPFLIPVWKNGYGRRVWVFVP